MSVDKDMLEAMRAMMAEQENRMRAMMQEELKPINQRLESLEQGQQEQAEFERGTRVLVEGINKNIRLLAEGHGANAAKLQQLDRMESTLNNVKSDTEVIKGVVSWHSDAIDNLKKA